LTRNDAPRPIRPARAPALLLATALLVTGALHPAAVHAQAKSGLAGIAGGNSGPVNIEAETLEVRDQENMAIFSGNVVVVQGDVTLRTARLRVDYEGGARQAGQQTIKSLLAEGKVHVTSKDQVVTGDTATFDMATQMITVTGDVVLSQGKNVVRGPKLFVDLNTGRARVESSAKAGKPGRVQGVFMPNSSTQ
jgi:lipopolysaccharide export system protein LptA